ncbi:FimD/PapC N-terminal domain-containing protein [Apirhabdus apintestini]|nr:FimD/PapC N-terminal domain-containing protein [Enterobacteriaceae bacterium CA-0114]
MPPRTFLSCAISSLLCLSCCAKAETFNTQFLAGSAAQSDLSRVYQGNSLLPGDYSLDNYVNEEWKGRFAVDVRDSERDLRLKKKDFCGWVLNRRCFLNRGRGRLTWRH